MLLDRAGTNLQFTSNKLCRLTLSQERDNSPLSFIKFIHAAETTRSRNSS